MMECLKQMATHRMGTKIGSPPFSTEGRSKTVLSFRCSGSCCSGSIATPSRGEKCMTTDHVPYNVGNVATPEVAVHSRLLESNAMRREQRTDSEYHKITIDDHR